ncbi:MAG: septum formation initiator family protein [Pseudomonadota bacterium]
MSKLAFGFGIAVIALLVISLYRAKSGAKGAAAEIAAIEVSIDEARQEKTLLEAEFAHLSRREWIEEYARTRLGMGPARAEQFARETDLDSIIGPPTPPADERVNREGEAAQ